MAEGLDSNVSDVMPGGDAFQSALLRGTGLLLGGAAIQRAFQLAQAATGYGAAHGCSRALAVVGGIARLRRLELAEPAATFGVRVGRTVRLGAEGLVEDLERIWTAPLAIDPSARESPREGPDPSTATFRARSEAAAAVDPASKELRASYPVRRAGAWRRSDSRRRACAQRERSTLG